MFELENGMLVNLAQAVYVINNTNSKGHPWRIVFEKLADISITEEDYNKIKTFAKIQSEIINATAKAIL